MMVVSLILTQSTALLILWQRMRHYRALSADQSQTIEYAVTQLERLAA